MSESKLGILLNNLRRLDEQFPGIENISPVHGPARAIMMKALKWPKGVDTLYEIGQLVSGLDEVIGEVNELSRDQEIADAARAILNGGMMIDPDVKLSIRSVEDLIEWYKKSGQEELR